MKQQIIENNVNSNTLTAINLNVFYIWILGNFNKKKKPRKKPFLFDENKSRFHLLAILQKKK